MEELGLPPSQCSQNAASKSASIPDGNGLILKDTLWIVLVGPAERFGLHGQGSPRLPVPECILNRLLALFDPGWIGGRDQPGKIAFRDGGGSDL